MSMSGTAKPHTKWPFAVLFGVLGAVVVGIVVLAFVWPAATLTARNLPVGLSGPSAQVTALKQALAKQSTKPFDFVSIDSRADAVTQIKERKLYGAILLGDSPEVLTSSAAASASNQALRSVAAELEAQLTAGVEQGLIAKLQQSGTALAGLQQEVAALQAALKSGDVAAAGAGSSAPSGASSSAAATTTIPSVTITDVVPLSSHDSTGAGLAAASFPLVLGGMLGGVCVSLLVVGPGRRIVALIVYGIAAGATVTLVTQTLLHVLQRDWLVNAAAFGLGMAATASIVVGFNSLLGPAGIGAGSFISLLIGNPISGATLPYQFIAGPWGEVGQDLVPGAAASLIRSLSYFPEADVTKQWIVLAAWFLGGIVLTVVGHFRSAAPVPLPEFELERDRVAVA